MPGVRMLSGGKWTARIRKNGSRHKLGTFDTQLEASIAYNAAKLALELAKGGVEWTTVGWLSTLHLDQFVAETLHECIAEEHEGSDATQELEHVMGMSQEAIAQALEKALPQMKIRVKGAVAAR
jgi:hypothetical protein